ncbi:MAG TPA: NAD-dependent succinate-semialdehyde dehydrogenase [Casimicrobiaceae bacterium]|jgi:succinate-semialdehyde dehydrogenase / glutarate-semialdehyde dehydrogenase|nr:NAD-dependent succinate-semialdehyde dehydrogenase [Casimicrobiaceae bacterium]
MSIEAINPATGEVVGRYEETAPADVDAIVKAAHAAYTAWRRRSYAERAVPMHAIAGLLRARARPLAELMAREMGKPVRDGVAEAQKCATACEHYAEHAERLLAREPVATEAHKSFVTFNPLGVVLAVMPWNFPFWQVFRFAAPGLMAGNAAVLKHASNVPGCAMAIESLFTEAGFPPNLFRTLMIGSKQVESVVAHPLVRAATLTGSAAAGRAIARKAGELLKKTVLELGGSDPYLVLDDADPDVAAEICTRGRLVNSGQSCIAAKRFIVVGSVRERFERSFVERMAAKRMGDPLREDVDIGPQARKDLRDALHGQVQRSIAKGARCLLGGSVPDGPGAFYPPTVLTDVGKGMPAFDEELFGPVAAIIAARDERHAIDLANDSSFGLGGAVITRDRVRGERIAADEMESGCVFVNDNVKSDVRLPFGGVKESGYGRELSGYGIREFVNIKTVWVA